jgi:hypothetical protein
MKIQISHGPHHNHHQRHFVVFCSDPIRSEPCGFEIFLGEEEEEEEEDDKNAETTIFSTDGFKSNCCDRAGHKGSGIAHRIAQLVHM